jgi:putative membrane protein
MYRSICSLILVIAAPAAIAQVTGNPGGLAPDTPGIEAATPNPDFANNQDKLFVRQAAMGHSAEVEIGKQAAGKSGNPSVKDFAARMQKDHSSSRDKLMRAGKAAKVDIPRDLDAEHQRIRNEIGKLSGAEYDRAYLMAQMEDHAKTVNLLLWHLSYGQNADLLRYSSETLPTVLDHLEHAKREHAALTQAPPRS